MIQKKPQPQCATTSLQQSFNVFEGGQLSQPSDHVSSHCNMLGRAAVKLVTRASRDSRARQCCLDTTLSYVIFNKTSLLPQFQTPTKRSPKSAGTRTFVVFNLVKGSIPLSTQQTPPAARAIANSTGSTSGQVAVSCREVTRTRRPFALTPPTGVQEHNIQVGKKKKVSTRK